MIRETTHFISEYHETDVALAGEFISLLEQKFEEIHKEFHLNEATQKYHFVLCKDVDEFIEKTGKNREEYQDWMVGNSNFETFTISILSPRVVTDRSHEDMEKVAVHELVHMMFDDATQMSGDDVEPWIAEGIAILYAEQTDLNYISVFECPKVADLIGFDNFVDNQGYDYAGVYVWYFIQKYGFEKFIKVYRGECEWRNLIYDEFETEAVRAFAI